MVAEQFRIIRSNLQYILAIKRKNRSSWLLLLLVAKENPLSVSIWELCWHWQEKNHHS